MNHLDLQIEQFLRALTIYMENPDINTSFQLQRRAIYLRDAVREHDKEIEKRVTDSVLNALSIKLEKDGAIEEIKSLKKAIDDLGR